MSTFAEQCELARRELCEARDAVREVELAKPLEQVIDEVLARSRSSEPVKEKPTQIVRAYVRRGPFGIVAFGPSPNSSRGSADRPGDWYGRK